MRIVEIAWEMRSKLLARAIRYYRNKWDAEEAVQDLMLTLVEQEEKIQGTEIRFPNAYLFQAIRFMAIEEGYKRKKAFAKRLRFAVEFEEKTMLDYGQAYDALVLYNKALSTVQGRRREALELAALGYREKEIAIFMDIAIHTVEQHLQKGRRVIRKVIGEHDYVLRQRLRPGQKESRKARLAVSKDNGGTPPVLLARQGIDRYYFRYPERSEELGQLHGGHEEEWVQGGNGADW